MSSYYITLAFFSEPNFQGNMSLYYIKEIKGNRISYAGTASKKLYVRKSSAIKAAQMVKQHFPTAKVEVHEIYPINGAFNTQVIE